MMMQEFDSKTVNLAGKNLIEASAGTGKTYSIAILVLRMIVEKRIPVEKILMVTFTKAAVAELESRIRKFIRLAYKYSLGNEIENQSVRYIVDNTGKLNSCIELKKAVQSLDQLSVMTIHSFCERSLMQYPFETGQAFKFEISTDISDIRDRIVDEYWRKKITTLKKDLYKHFTKSLTREIIREILKKALDDKEYLCDYIDEDQVLQQIKELLKESEAAYQIFQNHIRNNFRKITSRCLTGPAKAFIEKFGSSPAVFIDAYILGYSKGTQYIKNSFPEEYDLYSEYYTAKNTLDKLSGQYIHNLFRRAINSLKDKVTAFKTSRRIIDFNDQIRLLHEAANTGLVNSVLAAQYEAVFIDEFQDTDRHQYEIFSKIFRDNIIFYIGDPKQSIYGWRKADIETYKKARNEVDAIYSMNLNFRSTAELIGGLNNFFSIEDPFADKEIKYSKVGMGLRNLGYMTNNKTPVTPFDIYGFNNKSEIESFTVNEIFRLLASDKIKINGERVKPSDIAIIVRSNKQGRAFKKLLSGADIPAITIDDSKVMESDEAQVIRYLMEAVIQPNRGALNRVLLNPCFGIDSELVGMLDDETHIEQFRELKLIWHDSGIYNMLFRFFDLYQLRQHSLEMGIEGQRILTNLYQIAEILNQAELKNSYTPTELLIWMQRSLNEVNEEYEQRVESQDDAVQITTIHKCKGLTYKIVFAPFLDLVIKPYPIFEFREEGSYKFTHQPTDDQQELWHEQSEQENRRLIYVALTRAQYKVYLCKNNSSRCADSSLNNFPVRYQIQFDTDVNDALSVKLRKSELSQFVARTVPEIEIINTFGIHSFSSLSRAHYSSPFEKAELGQPDDYDQFIFQDLGRGASLGTALHSIFERLNFNEPDTWMQTLRETSKYYPDIIREENLELFRQLVNHVMNVTIGNNGEAFKLSDITNEKKLPELEFCFSMENVNKTLINDLLGVEASMEGEADIEGLMTGFIDLVFSHGGKYYILDWKSNHLGNSTDCYNRESLEEAMKASNYNLQYLIYTVALKRWLESRIEDFDYERQFGGVIYVFLRGVREGQDSGIYVLRPEKQDIESLDRAMKSITTFPDQKIV